MRRLEVLSPGLLTTVQDPGRPGFASLGIPPSGALDAEALRFANLAVGNDPDAAGLEVWFDGPTLRAQDPVVVCVLGGRFLESPVVALPAGAEIRLRSLDGSPRAVIAVQGGINVPRVLGSRSTSVAAGFGGLLGRRLARGDVLPLGDPLGAVVNAPPPPDLFGTSGEEVVIRVLEGPQAGLFGAFAWESFHGARYRILPESNRVGFRLSGGPLQTTSPVELPSEGAVLGSIQVPRQGEPIVLLHEGPPTGGYPKLATVIAADRGRLVRTRPDQRLRFRLVSIDEALDARRSLEARIETWRSELKSPAGGRLPGR